MTKTIAIDAMGGDFGPSITVLGSLYALQKDPSIRIILVGIKKDLEDAVELNRTNFDASIFQRIALHFVTEVVESDEPVANALRYKKDSSMRVSVDLIKEGKAHACVSSGNTGALMAISRFVLKMVEGIDRPAILTRLPTNSGRVTHVIDVGANVDAPANILCQFAVMGSIIAHALEGIQEPEIALLNIGEEIIKGNEIIKQAGVYLSEAHDLNYKGFIEASDLFKGNIDVIVCDGFVGNVALKTAEGFFDFLRSIMISVFGDGFWVKIMSIPFHSRLKKLKQILDPREYNGASLVGLNGLVIKSHGSSDAFAFSNAVSLAANEIDKDIPSLMSKHSKIFLSFLNSLGKEE